MSTSSPSKYHSLKYLLSLVESNFYDHQKKIDFDPEETLDLIRHKQQKTSEVLNRQFVRRGYIKELITLKIMKLKRCSCCGDLLSFKKFHKDTSKKMFALRRHCIECRKIPF